LGVVLAYAWAAYPFTLWTLSSNTNDSLVALLVVATLLVTASPAGRGMFVALATLTKFAPVALLPLWLRGSGDGWPRPGAVFRCLLVFGATLALAMLPVLLDGNLHAFWHDTIVYQADRLTPFSVWGLWGGLGLEQHLVEGAVVALALVVAVIPRHRGLVEVAALAAAVLIALELAAGYWLYGYLVWFFPAVAVAVFGAFPARSAEMITRPVPGSVRSRSPALARQL
jgi:hypothetical protein